MEYFVMNNGVRMPMAGIGVFLFTPAEAESAVKTALSDGVRLIDTANAYLNEKAVGRAIKAADLLKEQGIDATVIDMFTIKPLDEELVLKYAEKTGAVVTVENHNAIGGLYSAVADVLAAKCPTRMARVAVEDEFGEVGPVDYLAERFGLTTEHIVEAAESVVVRE